MTAALVFPGQGAQEIGMGKSLADHYLVAREVFQEVDEALSENLSNLIWNGTLDELTLTQNVQPALMTTSMATLRVLEAEGLDIKKIDFLAGHSLGEYTALCAAGALTLTATARLLRLRGRSMQDAVKVGEGRMAAILGLDIGAVQEIVNQAAQNQVCQIANDNDPKQIVVSGHAATVERACQLATDSGARRVVMLQVSAPFHCSLMEPAQQVMREALKPVAVNDPTRPVVANYSASPIYKAELIKESLVRQITARVRWRETMMLFASSGVTRCLEIGPRNVLSGLMRRTTRSINCVSAGNADQIEKALDLVRG